MECFLKHNIYLSTFLRRIVAESAMHSAARQTLWRKQGSYAFSPVSFMRYYSRRGGEMLGSQCYGTGDSILSCGSGFSAYILKALQLGDGTRSGRVTPVDVVGLSSGVVSIALGEVGIVL